MPTIALISDFGTHDWFVAELKGVILSINPSVVIVDITHEITPGDVHSTAFFLQSCAQSFPPGTIFCIAVDPGSDRNCPIIIAKTDIYTFVSPDNGALSYVLNTDEHVTIVKCNNNDFFRQVQPATFRGRDIIAPVSAHCTFEIPVSRFGPLYKITKVFDFPTVQIKDNKYISKIVYIDHFGNLISSIKNEQLSEHSTGSMVLSIDKSSVIVPVEQYYNQVQNGRLLVYQGSAGFVEIAVSGGNASEMFDARIGDIIGIEFTS